MGKATENVVIRYSLAQQGHGGITCGSETAGGIKNIYLHDCVFDGTQVGIRFKTRRSRGGGVNDILYERIRMFDVGEAFKWDLLGSAKYVGELAERYPPRPINKLTPIVKNIHIRNFIVESAEQVLNINAIPEVPCSNVLIEYPIRKCEVHSTCRRNHPQHQRRSFPEYYLPTARNQSGMQAQTTC